MAATVAIEWKMSHQVGHWGAFARICFAECSRAAGLSDEIGQVFSASSDRGFACEPTTDDTGMRNLISESRSLFNHITTGIGSVFVEWSARTVAKR